LLPRCSFPRIRPSIEVELVDHDDRTLLMASVTHQTVRLSRGKHASPEEGACVMELASMLAGEPFSDQPASVSPVVGALLRAYNDALDDERRQELYVCAAKVVGSRGSRGVEQIRAERLTAWGSELERHRSPRSRPFRRLRRLAPRPPIHVVAARAVRTVSTRGDRPHLEVLALVDELLAMGAPMQALPQKAVPVAADGQSGAVTWTGW
jgi:hypothetical protein